MWPKIIELLKSQGFSQKALAELVGVDQSTICRLEAGRGPEPRFSAGMKLIELAGGWPVVGGVSKATEPPPRVDAFSSAIHSIAPTQGATHA